MLFPKVIVVAPVTVPPESIPWLCAVPLGVPFVMQWLFSMTKKLVQLEVEHPEKDTHTDR